MAQKKIEIIGTTFVDGQAVQGTPAKPVAMSVSEEDYASLMVAGKGRDPSAAKKEKAEPAA